MKTAVFQYLPEKCKTHFIISPGIIGSFPNVKPLELERGYAISGLMFPYISGLDIFNIAIDEQHCNVTELLPSNSSLKCLLVFATSSEHYLNVIIRKCLEKENFRLAVGGAIVSRAESLRGSVVAFCGESIEAASVILKQSDDNSETERKLKTFQQTDLLGDRCFALMFVCVARGVARYGTPNVESSMFHKLYPSIPIFGVYGNGEIGVDYIPGITDPFPNTKLLELEHGCAISGLMFPYISGLDIYNIAIDEQHCNVSASLPPNSSMKCLLVFATSSEYYLNVIIRQCLEKENFRLAVGGAIVRHAESLRGSVVAFCGESVEAASIILQRSDDIPEVERKLKTFQQTGLLGDHCFAFMFVGVAPRNSFHDVPDYESSVFRKLYPTIPIFGVYGNGELGVNYIPGNPARSDFSERKDRYFYGFATVIVLVSVQL